MNKLVIFDCDGVLIDSEALANEVHAAALTSYGYPITAEESVRKFTGLTPQAVCEMVLQEAGIDLSIDYWEKQEPHIFQEFEKNLRPLMRQVLQALKTMQVMMCVASNSQRDYVIRCLKLTKQFDYFQERGIFTAEQVKQGKPAPDLFLLAAKEMGFDPKDCIVIEDSSAGIKAALAAGMEVVSFLGGGHAQYDFYKAKIQTFNVPIAKSCEELCGFLKRFTSLELALSQI